MKTIIASLLLFMPFVHANTQFSVLFGSCSHQDSALPILDAVNKESADLFVFLGDNIYGDTQDMSVLKAKYDKLGRNSRFKTLTEHMQTVAIWDDHDFGENDAGKEYPFKEQSRKIMLDFWQEPASSKRRSQKHGIYTSKFIHKGDKKIHIIMPDLRWNRDKLNTVSREHYVNDRKPNNMGPYSPSDIEDASMLGDAQWQWLKNELLAPADIKIIASSLQLLPEFTGWESWANFPRDRERLLQFINMHDMDNVLIISGDTHWGEISNVALDNQMLWEITSSGLSEEWKAVSPNKHRVGDFTHSVNYGFIHIEFDDGIENNTDGKDDENNKIFVQMGLKDIEGKVTHQHNIIL